MQTHTWLILALMPLSQSVGMLIQRFAPFISEYFVSNNVPAVTLFLCHGDERLQLSKTLMSAGVRVQAPSAQLPLQLQMTLAVDYYRLGVVVDLDCPSSTALLQQAGVGRMFSRLHWWLLVSAGAPGLHRSLCVSPPIDSHVTYVWELSGVLQLVEVYQVKDASHLVTSPVASWRPGDPIPLPSARDDLGGAVLRVGIVAVEDSWEHHADLRYRHLDTWNKFGYIITSHVAHMMNYSMNETVVHSWGYLAADGNFTGLVGLLQRHEVDIGGCVSVMTTERFHAIDFTADTLTFWPRFIFRQPSLSSVTNIYVMPFSAGVWATYLVSVVVLAAVMYLVQNSVAHQRHHDNKDLSEILLSSLGNMCQQGWLKTPQDAPSRIIFVCLALLSMFFFTSYSAVVVSLLQSPSSAINSLHDLVTSPMKIAFYDVLYNINIDNYVNISASPVVRRLFAERVVSQPREKVFLSEEEGMVQVQRGRFAFHLENGAYKYIAEKWQEAEKCDLAEVFMVPPSTTSLIPVQKNSPYKKLVTIKLRRLREVGLVSREKQRLAGNTRPRCQNHGLVFVSVGLEDFQPALLLLAAGSLLSIVMLVLECAYLHAPFHTT